MARLFSSMEAISRWTAYLGAAALVGIAGVILLEIVLRTIFSTSTFMATELVGYGVAAMCFLALPNAFDRGTQIRVEILPNLLRRHRGARVVLEVVCCLLTLFIVGVATWAFGYNVLRQFERGYWSGTMSQMPLWIPQGIVLAGLVLLWIQVLVYLVKVAVTRQVMADENLLETRVE